MKYVQFSTPLSKPDNLKGPRCLIGPNKWRKSTKAERERVVWSALRHPLIYYTLESLTKDIPLPKFLTAFDYYLFSSMPPSDTDFMRAFQLSEKGLADPEVVKSYEAWYNCEAPYEIEEIPETEGE